jgi:hypothetical protein
MGILQNAGIERVYHYAPLHYLAFIARERALLGKPSLAQRGYSQTHLRSKSSQHDVVRGFGTFAFLTLEDEPRILKAKLFAGFPHIGIGVPVAAVDTLTYDLCRFNVAMTRKLRRGDKPGHAESSSNGRYYGQHEIPVARTAADKAALLAFHLHETMIEVLIHGDVPLPDDTVIQTYSQPDEELATSVLQRLGVPWPVLSAQPPGPYNRRADYSQAVTSFLDTALSDKDWRGNGLEFDRV